MTLGATPLAGETPHLRLHLADHVVQSLKILRRLLQPPLRPTLAITIEADARRFLKE